MRRTLLAVVACGGLVLAPPEPARAQSQNCIVKQAADAAVQRQIALIDAAKVNPSAFFNGPNSCVAADLLKRFDLSNLIPDLSGFLASGAQNLLTSVIDAAKRQVCQILDQQLTDTIRSINQQMTSFQSSLSGDLFRQLNGAITPITLPNIGLGTYRHVQNASTGNALDIAPAAAPTISTSPQPGTSSTTTGGSGTTLPGSAYGGALQ